MSTVLCWLEGPMQSWGGETLIYRRETRTVPSKSAVVAMLFNVMGLYDSDEQNAVLEEIRTCNFTVIGYQSFHQIRLSDYQSIGTHWDEKDAWEDLMIPKRYTGQRPQGGPAGKILRKDYLQDCIFAALVDVPNALGERLKAALASPCDALSLGRKACLPSLPPVLGVWDSKEEAEACLEEFLVKRNEVRLPVKPQFIIRDALEGEEGKKPWKDNPISYRPLQRQATRDVVFEKVA